jgi:hypothetical protein
MSRARRVLGFAVGSGKIGFAYLVDGELMDWRLSIKASRSFDKAFRQALDWITYYAPEMVVLEEIPADTRKGAYTQSLLLAIESAANNVNVEHVRIARPASGPNKYADAAELAAEFPQIASWLPHPRRLWETEPRNVIYFEALALVWAWWKSSGRGFPEESADA